jgi:hypothetical protein
MNGEAPVAIPTTFKNTKFPSVAEKIKNLVTSREEALAAHNWQEVAWRKESSQTSFRLKKVKWFGWIRDI